MHSEGLQIVIFAGADVRAGRAPELLANAAAEIQSSS